MKAWVWLLLLWPSVSATLDLNSYCKGLCTSRYQDGIYVKSRGKCGCMDFYPVNLENRIDRFYRQKEKKTYYGSDSKPQAKYDLPWE